MKMNFIRFRCLLLLITVNFLEAYGENQDDTVAITSNLNNTELQFSIVHEGKYFSIKN